MSECGRLDTAVALNILMDDRRNISEDFTRLSERFFETTRLLNKGEFLGLQMMSDATGKNKLFVFSSPGTHISKEDYDWIFQDYASTNTSDDFSFCPMDSLFEQNRRVYKLSYTQKSSEHNDFEDSLPDNKNIQEMVELLMKEKAIIRIVLGNFEDGTIPCGMVYISLPESLTLRVRSSIALAYPCFMVEEVAPDSERKESLRDLRDKCFADMVKQLLFALYCQKKEHTFDERDAVYIPIEELDLSIRSYNCLRRAGIDSVGQLRRLSEDDLLHIRNLGRKGIEEIKQKLLEVEDLTSPIPLEKTDYLEMLDSLIGLENVKEQIRKIAAFAKMRKDMSSRGMKDIPIALNMEFVGNPGTAKTTVARIVAGIFQQIGLLSGNELIEVGRADLVAKYEGQTASKVKDVFSKAKGKVLFIDEAYSLVESWKGSFGEEAINTIVQEMENNRENTVVIFAGYPDKMEEFLSGNPGLRSRVPFRIKFNDYSVDEMIQIAESEANKRGFTIGTEAYRKMTDMCSSVVNHPEMGNGRFCRNMIENAILEYASRVYGSDHESIENDFILEADDFSPIADRESTKNMRIGFRS